MGIMNIIEIKQFIDETFREGIPSEEQLETIISMLKDPTQLRCLLSSIVEDSVYSDKCATRSEIHRLGFNKLSLLITEKYQLRLHIWWPTYDSIQPEGIHNHKFNFASCIIKGSFRNDIYERCYPNNDDALERHEYLAHPVNTRQYDCFEYCGLTNIKVANSSILLEGQIYYMDNESFHSIQILNSHEITATLFLRTSDVKTSDVIFEEIPFTSTINNIQSVSNQPISPELYRESLTRFISYL